MRLFLTLPLLLAACSTAPDTRNQAEPAATGSPVPAASNPPRRQDSGAKPVIADLRTFKDWVVGCDNTRRCKAVALMAGDALGETLLASIERSGDGGTLTVRITGVPADAKRGDISVDGTAVALGGIPADGAIAFTDAPAPAGSPPAEQPARRAAEAIARGKAATLSAGGAPVPLSLAGAAAGLRWMDAAQGLAGTPAALVAKGSGQPRATPPAEPAVHAVAGFGAPQPLATADAAKLRKLAGCTIAEYLDPAPAGTSVALGDGNMLLLVPCDTGAYNLMSAAFIRDAQGNDRGAPFDAETGIAPDPVPVAQPVNAEWRNGVLTTFAKGRGIGDCGSMQRFAWDGTRFRLVEQRDMGECRGSTDFIVTWRAAVAR